ncbi:hypothetical protein [Pseudoclavibacter sp. VKM Ac-2888]|uniref:hypothetical protein n=1 Tax=Pseudoclavibacter sp. VKM Ac-2888 TaxID=2783830 RepID=UPI00188C827D|nr:hypothetical protein [Pseudoclavibacter sp. VKM Ac-2888]MBF4549658.1 hypothetical protein [Pseudoclavibacter sp. VKM Ac-2888]
MTRRHVLRVWQVLTDPDATWQPVLFAYVATVVMGVVTYAFPPTTIEGAIGSTLATIWAACMIGGGLIGLGTMFTPHMWLEKIALSIAAVGGLLVYAFVVGSLHASAPPGASRLTQLSVIFIALSAYWFRWVAIRKHTYAPRGHRRKAPSGH